MFAWDLATNDLKYEAKSAKEYSKSPYEISYEESANNLFSDL